MADYRLHPLTLFGRNRDEPEVWVGYVDADAGSISALTKLSIAETNWYGPDVAGDRAITLDAANDEIDLAANHLYEIEIFVDQTGASGLVDIFNATGTAVIMTSPAEEGMKRVKAYFHPTVATTIYFRADDQTANTSSATTSQITVRVVGKVKT